MEYIIFFYVYIDQTPTMLIPKEPLKFQVGYIEVGKEDSFIDLASYAYKAAEKLLINVIGDGKPPYNYKPVKISSSHGNVTSYIFNAPTAKIDLYYMENLENA